MAEVSIAFTGFSGVVGVFGGGSALFDAERLFRVRTMVLSSLAAFLGSLLPVVLAEFDSATALVWSVCCPAFATYFIFQSISVFRRTRALSLVGNYSRPWFAPIIYSINALLVVALIGATARLLPGHSIYIAAVLWQLVLASLQFLLLVLRTEPRSVV